MGTLPETASICGIVFLAALVRSTLGFGEALVAMPLLAFVVPVRTAAPLLALVSILNGIAILVREWRHVSFRATLGLTLPALVAVPLGVWLLRSGEDRFARGLLAVVILAYAAWSLRVPTRSVVLQTDRFAPVAGLLAGFLGGAYNASGPPIVVYGTLRRWPPERFRATLQSYFIVGSLWIGLMHFLAGLTTSVVLTTFLFCVPVVLLANLAGHYLGRRLPPERFLFAVHVALLVLGAVLLASVMP